MPVQGNVMQKKTGNYILECYDKYSHREQYTNEDNFLIAKGKAEAWENKSKGNTAIVSRILYNSVCKQKDKWSYDD